MRRPDLNSLSAAVMGLVLSCWSSPVRAEEESKPAAQASFENGLKAYAARDFDLAAADLAASCKLDPRRACIFAWAQALRLGGRCDEAVPLYERFLALGPPAQEAEHARQNLALCRSRVVREQTDTVTAAVQRAPDPPLEPRVQMQAPIPEVAPSSPWYADPWLDSLLIGGAAGLGAGAAFSVSAGARDHAARLPSSDLDDFRRSEIEAARFRTAALICVSAGATMLVGGAFRWLLRS
jgi:hypothetical protein